MTGPSDLNGTTYDYGPIPLANGAHTIKATPTLAGGPRLRITTSAIELLN